MKHTKAEILEVRKQAKTIRQWYLALGVTYNTLQKWCKKFNIPFNLVENYIEPVPPRTDLDRNGNVKVENNNNVSSSVPQQWDPNLTGQDTKLPQPAGVWVGGGFRQIDKSSFRVPGNPLYRTPGRQY